MRYTYKSIKSIELIVNGLDANSFLSSWKDESLNILCGIDLQEIEKECHFADNEQKEKEHIYSNKVMTMLKEYDISSTLNFFGEESKTEHEERCNNIKSIRTLCWNILGKIAHYTECEVKYINSNNSNNHLPEELNTDKTRHAAMPFSQYIVVENKDNVLNTLHKLIDGKKGKIVAQIMTAAEKAGLISRPTFTAVKDEFGDIGNKSGYNKSMNLKFTDKELSPFIKELEKLVQQ